MAALTKSGLTYRKKDKGMKLILGMESESEFELCMRWGGKVSVMSKLKMNLSDLERIQKAVNTINEVIIQPEI